MCLRTLLNFFAIAVTSADNSSTDLVICLNEFKMGVIAKAVILPGANTLIMNLLTSVADDKVSITYIL